MIGALVLFSLDTLALVGINLFIGEIPGIIDIAIHAWVLYYLIMGVVSGYKLKNMPQEPQAEYNGEAMPQLINEQTDNAEMQPAADEPLAQPQSSDAVEQIRADTAE